MFFNFVVYWISNNKLIDSYIDMSKTFTISIPKELAGISLKQYQKYIKTVKYEEGKEPTKEEIDFANLKLLECFCGITMKQAYNLPLTEFSGIIGHIAEMFKEEVAETQGVPRVQAPATQNFLNAQQGIYTPTNSPGEDVATSQYKTASGLPQVDANMALRRMYQFIQSKDIIALMDDESAAPEVT